MAFEHRVFTEASDPEGALEAQRMHAEGYVDMGFVGVDALTADGRLPVDIDQGRGPGMDYYLANVVGQPRNAATLRIHNLAPGQTHEDLAAWKMSKDALSWPGHQWVENLGDQTDRLKEVHAMARAAGADRETINGVLRAAIHNALGKDEFWFSTLVSDTRRALVPRYSEANLRILGNNVTIDDPRIKKNLELTPIVLRPDDFLDNIAEAYQNATKRVELKNFGSTLMFFSDGLPRDKMSSHVHEVRQIIQFSRLRGQ